MLKKLFTLFLLPFACAIAGEESLTVGMTSGYAPFVSLNEKGEYEGFDIDLAEELSKRLGRKLVLKDLGSMPSLMLGLKQGQIDALIWAVSITEERKKNMEMIYYQGDQVSEMPLVFWKGVPEGIKTWADLRGKPVCAEAGSYQESVLKKVEGIQLKYLDKAADAVLELKYGKSLATCLDASLLPKLQKQFPQLKIKMLTLPPEERSLGNGICIAPSNRKLAAEVQMAVEKMREEGKIAELEKKWGLTQ